MLYTFSNHSLFQNLLFLFIVGLVVFYVVYFIKGLFKTVEGGNTSKKRSIEILLLDGLNIPQGTKLVGEVTDETISLTNSDFDINLSVKNIVSVIKSEVEVTQKGISFKNAIIGGALFGQLGATMGAFKGKDNQKIGTVVVSYEDNNGEIKEMTFMPSCIAGEMLNVVDARNGLNYFYNKINEVRSKNNIGKKVIEI